MARRHRLAGFLGILFLLLATQGHPAAAEDGATELVGDLGAPDRLLLRGLVSIDSERLRRPLVADDELVWLSGPDRPRQPLLDGLARKAEQALKLAGFATAGVVPSVETIDATERVVLTITEGPRLEAGEILVCGLPEELAGRLPEYLRTSLPEESAIPEITDHPDGTRTIRWLDKEGKLVSLEAPAWPRSGFAPCNDGSLERVRAVVTRFLKEEGYLNVAPHIAPAKRRGAERLPQTLVDAGIGATVDVSDGRTTRLVVTVGSLPQPVRLTQIELPRRATTSPEELARFLGIRVGTTVTQRDRLEWMGRLRDSARFLRHDVELVADPLDPEGMIARFDLDEYAPMMPLSRPLSREEETLLRARRWLLEATAEDRELVVEMKAPTDTDHGATAITLIASATRGTAIFFGDDEEKPNGLVSSPGRLCVIAPSGDGWFDVPLSSGDRHTFILFFAFERPEKAEPAATAPPQERDLGRRVRFAWRSQRSNHAAGEFAVILDLPPSTYAALLHEEEATATWEGDELVIEKKGRPPTRIDAATGRIHSMDLRDYHATVDQREGALEEATRLATASGRALAEPDRPVSSALRFLATDVGPAWLDRWMELKEMPEPERASLQRIATIAARVIGNWDRTDALAPIDRWLAATVSEAADAQPADDLAMPVLGISGTGSPSGILGMLAAWTWRGSEKRLGSAAWPTAIARTYVSSLGGGERYREETQRLLSANDFGPLAHLGMALMFRNTPLAATAASRGLERCTVDAFHADCAPFLDAATAVDLDGLVIGLLEGLDDEALRELGSRLASDPEMFLPLVEEIRRGERQTSGGMQATLDAWWEAGLGALVARCLDRLTTPPPVTDANKPILELDSIFPAKK